MTNDHDAIALYSSIRSRVTDTVAALDAAVWSRPVAACPAWTLHDLLAHMALLPAALASGDLPTGDVQQWIDDLVADGRQRTAVDLAAAWPDGPAIAPYLAGHALLLVDLAIHEHDARATIGLPPLRDRPEVGFVLDCTLQGLGPTFRDAGLGSVEVTFDGRSWRSDGGQVGWSLHVDPWEATRLLESRRTADEILATPGSGGGPAYVAALHGHSPLPAHSLGET